MCVITVFHSLAQLHSYILRSEMVIVLVTYFKYYEYILLKIDKHFIVNFIFLFLNYNVYLNII